MPTIERTVVFGSRDTNGSETIDYPVTKLENIDGSTEVKETPELTDYIPVIDMADGGKMKKTPAASLKGETPSAADIGAVPNTTTVNGKPLTGDINLNASDVGAVPAGRTVNNKPLTEDISLSASDVGALPVNGYITAGKNEDTTLGDNATAEGYDTTASGANSHAEGACSEATLSCAHAEGQSTHATGENSHAEGYGTTAFGTASHAEGRQAKALGDCSHAEGKSTAANGSNSHAEGANTTVSNHADCAHAEGWYSKATGKYSHAEGHTTTASNFASHAGGKFNSVMTDGATEINSAGDVFVIGNGTSSSSLSNAFRITYAGAVYVNENILSTGADYAEYFEWADGNPGHEDRVGYFVTMDGNKIRLANPGEYILGIVSGLPCVIGNGDEDWLGRWQHDEFGRFIKEYLAPTGEVDEGGNLVEEVVDYETPSWRHKANPDYDPEQKYIERKDRPEWDAVGMMGVLSVRDDGSCEVNGYCRVQDGGMATKAETYTRGESWRVIARVSENVVNVVFR